MRLGQIVPGREEERIFFVAEDAHDITRRVQEYDPEARLAVRLEDEALLLMRYASPEHWPATEPGEQAGGWLIGFTFREPDGTVITGEPDARLLDMQRRADTWRRVNPQGFRQRLRMAVAAQERRRKAMRDEWVGPAAERMAFDHCKRQGDTSRAFIGNGLA